MAAGYDPYQQNFQMGDAMGGIGRNILSVLALFGSQTLDPDNPVGDYDLLILVCDPPVSIFQTADVK